MPGNPVGTLEVRLLTSINLYRANALKPGKLHNCIILQVTFRHPKEELSTNDLQCYWMRVSKSLTWFLLSIQVIRHRPSWQGHDSASNMWMENKKVRRWSCGTNCTLKCEIIIHSADGEFYEIHFHNYYTFYSMKDAHQTIWFYVRSSQMVVRVWHAVIALT